MSNDSQISPLPSNQPIVNPKDGTPTIFMMRWAQERGIELSDGITADQAQELIDATLASIHVIAGTGLTGGGPLSADVTLDATGGGGGGSVEVDNPSGTPVVLVASKLSFSGKFDVTVGAAGEALIDLTAIGAPWVSGPTTGTGASQVITDSNFAGLTAAELLVIVNGQLWDPTSDYTVSGSDVTLTTHAAGDSIIIRPLFVSAGGGGGSAYGNYDAPPTLPRIAGFTAVNWGANTHAVDGKVTIEFSEYTNNNQDLKLLVSNSMPASPWRVYARADNGFDVNGGSGNGWFYVRNAAGNRYITFGGGPGSQIFVTKWTSLTSGYAGTAATLGGTGNRPKWWSMENDGTNFNCYSSQDGYDWMLCYTETLATFLSDIADTGLCVINGDTGTTVKYYSYSFTAPVGP